MWVKILIGFVLSFSFYWFTNFQKQEISSKSPVLKPPNVEVPLPSSRSFLHVYKNGAVCSDRKICSSIGSAILQRSGNVIDAAIGTLLCNGLVTMQSMGLGGGVIITFYKRQIKKAITIIGRERAPLNFRYQDIKQLKNGNSFSKSALSIAVPGELAAYHEAHSRYGSLPWFDIIEPTLNLCNAGYQLTRHQRDALFLNEDMIRKDNLLTQMFVNPKTNLFYKEGWHIEFPKQLCATYQLLAVEGALTFYNRTLASLIIQDLNEIGSPINMHDFNHFNAEIVDAIRVDLEPYYIYLPRPPGSGHVIGFIVKLLSSFKKEFSVPKYFNTKEVHRITEALKFGFVKRWIYDTDVDDKTLQNLLEASIPKNISLLIDDMKTFNNIQHYGAPVTLAATPDSGTAQISVLAPNGDAVSATSSINYYFGSGRMGRRSGILFNNAMCDFSFKSFENYFNLPIVKNKNEPKVQKQPMSSMSPLVVSSKKTGDIRLVVGAAGGSRIISTLVQILIRVLWKQQNIKEAIDAPRFHHQLLPNLLEYEFGILKQIVEGLETLGHKTERVRRKSTAVCGMERVQGVIMANADYRKEGAADGF